MASITKAQIPELFVKAVQQGAPLRTQAIQDLNKAVQDQAAALKIEQSRVTTLYGANSHQSVLMNERLLENSTLAKSVSGEIQQSQVRVPQPSAGEFIVYGRVLDNAALPLKDMEVSAIDPRGSTLVNAVSDSNGRFELHVAAAAPETVADEPEPVAEVSEPQAAESEPAAEEVVADAEAATEA